MTVGTYMKISVVAAAILGVAFFMYQTQEAKVPRNLRNITSAQDALALFPKTADEIKNRVAVYLQEAHEVIDAIIAVPANERTYANTMQPLDELTISDLAILNRGEPYTGSLVVLNWASPDKQVRKVAEEVDVTIKAFWVDRVSNNGDLYQAVLEYAEGPMQKEDITKEQERFVTETLKNFRRAGLNLSKEIQQRVVQLKKEQAELGAQFSKNIVTNNGTISMTRGELTGLSDGFIDSLEQTGDGLYVLQLDYPTVFSAMEHCIEQETRKRITRAFNNLAYPANKKVLEKLIAKRDELAKLLGFESYAAYDLDNQMVGSVERAENFIGKLIEKAKVKERQEFEQLIADLPSSVTLRPDGKMNSWDASCKKKTSNVKDVNIADYFPMEKTLQGLLNIYEQFFSLKFMQVSAAGTWHEDVRLLEVRNANDDAVRGYIFLDLHPRPNKYTNSCYLRVLASQRMDDGSCTPAVGAVLFHLPRPTDEKPSLLSHWFVKTFFHEFGHALHDVLGSTQVASFSGSRVKRDFFETPSQMLEEWMWDKEVLKNLSGHYQTGERLSDELIDRFIAVKQSNSGSYVQRYGYYAALSLAYFKEGAHKDLDAITRELHEKIRTNYAFDPEQHLYASFTHLNGYGARYYGYLWSKVFALDLFEEIKKHGLLNPEIGRKYVQEVIGKGGSEDPNTLLVNFLGREPNQDAFLKDLGL